MVFCVAILSFYAVRRRYSENLRKAGLLELPPLLFYRHYVAAMSLFF